jgi:hypothetical protein
MKVYAVLGETVQLHCLPMLPMNDQIVLGLSQVKL